jgi:hypothetical protein
VRELLPELVLFGQEGQRRPERPRILLQKIEDPLGLSLPAACEAFDLSKEATAVLPEGRLRARLAGEGQDELDFRSQKTPARAEVALQLIDEQRGVRVGDGGCHRAAGPTGH